MSVAPVLVAWCVAAALVAACNFDSGGVAIATVDAAVTERGLDAEVRVAPCTGLRCECRNAETCASACADDDCTMSCEHAGACANQCGDGCTHACESSGSCDLSCGDDCAARCEAVGTCVVVCGRDCVVDCRDTSSCSVTMIDGVVKCDRTSACEVTCRQPGGERRPPRRGADGSWFCDAVVD